MATSRYGSTPVIRNPALGEPAHYGTFDLPEQLRGYATVDWLSNQSYLEHVWAVGDRMDKLANKYFGDDEYWWIIALVNGVTLPLGVPVGTVLKIPSDVAPVLEKLGLR